jgi:hypothetical protein
MSHDAWIQQSLARLETLEAQKEAYEGAGYLVPPELGAEISALYEALESVAGSDGEAQPFDPAAESHAAMQQAAMSPAGGPWGPQPVAPGAPFGVPPAANPVAPATEWGAAVPAHGGYGGMAPATPALGYESFGDDDFEAPKSKLPLAVAAIVAVVAIGGGGAFLMATNRAEPPPQEPVGAATVINASSIPEDTQEPKAAKGADVDRTPTVEISDSPARRSTPSKSSSSSRRSSGSSKSSKDDGRKIRLSGDSRDPLAGLD